MARQIVNTLGSSTLSQKERSELDFYATNPKTVESLLKEETFDKDIWEPGSGIGNIVKVLEDFDYNVWSTDIYDYGCQDHIIDFLSFYDGWQGDIVMNPPYKLATEFVEKALTQIDSGHKVVALLRLQFLEGNKRYEKLFSKKELKTVYCFVNRQVCSANNDFTEGSAIAYAWFIWEKGFKGNPVIKWLKTN